MALRTLGLLALMHQAGLHVPAEAGSRLPVFVDVFADIGDEQSIAQSLSTFSGHLRSITRIVAQAGPATLVLLDELGAGTDPTEGSALAQALPGPLHPLRGAGRGHDALRRDQGLRARDGRGAQRVGRVRPRHAVAHVPAHDRAARGLAGVRHRGAARAAGGHRGRRAQPPVREPAGVRVDPGLHPHAGARDRRGGRAGAVGRSPCRGGAADRRRRAAPRPAGARRSRQGGARGGAAVDRHAQGRGGGRPTPAGARNGHALRPSTLHWPAPSGPSSACPKRRPRGSARPRTSLERGSSASGRAAGPAAGRAGSRHWRRVVRGRRSKPAVCASRSR